MLQGLCDPWPFWAPINIIGDLAVPVYPVFAFIRKCIIGAPVTSLIYGLLAKIATAWPSALHVYFDFFPEQFRHMYSVC